MSRNAIFRILNPKRRSKTIATALAAAVLTTSLQVGSPVQAQSVDTAGPVPGGIQQVVGKELSASRRTSSRNTSSRSSRSGGLFSGLFGGGSSSSSSSSKAGEPYRKATPVPEDRTVDWSGVPYHNSAPGRSTATKTVPLQDPGQASSRSMQARSTQTRSNVPTPPALNARSRSSVPTPSSTTRAPLATTTPRKVSSGSTPSTSSSRPAPLSVTRSSRRPVANSTPTKTTPSLVKKATPAPTPEPKVELVPKVSRKIVKKAETTPPAKKVAKSSTPTVSSRRVPAPKPDAVVAKAPVAAKAVAKAPVVAPKPAPKPPVVATNQPSVIQRTPAQSVPAPTTTKMILGEARQAPVGSLTSKTAQPLHSASSKAVAANSASAATEPAPTAMKTFGNNQAISRPSGALSAAGSGISLHPISDRLPTDTQGESMQAWHNSQSVSHDGFAARSAGQPESTTTPKRSAYPQASVTGQFANGPTSPNYQSAGYGQASTPAYPNAMRHPQGYANANQYEAANTATVQTPAINHTNDNSLSAASELPGIRVVTAGPRNITIRQTHTYEIRAENRGSINAEGLMIRAHIPDWADVVGQQASLGDVQAATEDTVRQLNWRIDRLDAGQSETMMVRLKASRPGTHDLDVDWTLQPQNEVVQIHVQEPKLALTIDGPDEVIYGQSKTYQIRVLNPGDCMAPDVVFTLSPESSTPQSQRIGDIPSGKEAQFEVELTAQDLGDLKIHGLAIGDLELRAEADKTVKVLAADLEAVLVGPEVKYQNSDAVYQLELTNHGTAASENVMALLQLPAGVSYLGGMEGASVSGNELRWKIASLTPGAVRQYQFQCHMESTGIQEFMFDCKGSAAGQTEVALETDIEAIADLVLSVDDPSAPAPVGENVTYTIVIRNRGSKPALDVRAVAQFSHGIEPQQIRGHDGQVITGQVLIEPIARIDAGKEVRMTIVAKAAEGGHHRFRTEVRAGDTVLVAEEATHYLAPRNERITRRSGPGGNDFSMPLR